VEFAVRGMALRCEGLAQAGRANSSRPLTWWTVTRTKLSGGSPVSSHASNRR